MLWQTRVFEHLLRLPMRYFEKRHVGDVVSRFHSLHDIQDTLTTQLVEGLLDGVVALVAFACFLINFFGVNLFASGLHSYAGV